MTAAQDMRVLRDALDMVSWGGLPSWYPATTALGTDTFEAAQGVIRKLNAEISAHWALQEAYKLALAEVQGLRDTNEKLTAQIESLEARPQQAGM